MVVYLLLGLELLWVYCVYVILIASAWTAPEVGTGVVGRWISELCLRLSWKSSVLEGDGLLQTKVVSPTMCSHLVADSRRPKWGDGLVDKDTMSG